MNLRPGRPCMICGRRVTDGSNRCEPHKGQANAAPTSCAVCGVRSRGAYCDEHLPDWGGKMSEAERLKRQPWRAGYRDPNYHRERQAALKRAAGRCERCGRSDMKLECDHVIPLSTGGTNDRSNFQILCLMCHRRKTAKRA